MDVFVARQPIFKKNKKIHGYELLFREGLSNFFPNIDSELATSKVLSTSFFSMGMDVITGGAPAYINFPENLLVKRVPLLFTPKTLMVEILEDVKPTAEVVRACEDICRKGFDLVLDDFSYRPELKELVGLAKIVKLDFRAKDEEELKDSVGKLAAYPVTLLAEKVETHEEYDRAAKMGFTLFQGYFFSKPEVLTGKDITSSRMHLVQIMAEANKEDFEFRKLEDIIARDVGMSYKLLRYVNSAYFRRVTEISSIKQAVVLLGQRQIRQFVSLMAMSQLASDKPSELIRSSIIRAKFCELVGKTCGNGIDPSELFTLGLFSLIDAILDNPMDQLMAKLPLSSTIKESLVNAKGALNDYLDLSVGYERGEWEGVTDLAKRLGLTPEDLPSLFGQALDWANAFSSL